LEQQQVWRAHIEDFRVSDTLLSFGFRIGGGKRAAGEAAAEIAPNGESTRGPMVTERPPSLQDTFLNHVREQETPLTVFLTNGVKLQGVIASFDNFSVMLVRDGFSQLIYKHAISTVMPLGPIKLLDDLAKTPSDRDRRPM
jgi:host factor-I protein